MGRTTVLKIEYVSPPLPYRECGVHVTIPLGIMLRIPSLFDFRYLGTITIHFLQILSKNTQAISV